MLNLERLRTLDALARHGSVSGAADGLHVTTSAVSQQMAKLEREVGQPLLAKNGRGVRLTDAGRLLADHAARIISQVELAQADVEAQRGCAVGELRIGAFPTAMRGLLPQALSALRAGHPDVRARVREQEPEESMAAVVRGDLDLALAIDWHNKRMPVPAELTRTHLLDDSVDIAVPAGHPLADRSRISLADFADDDWISWNEGQFCHEWLVFTLRGTGVEPRIAHIAEEHHTQLAFVEAGLGVCVAPRLGRGPVPPGCGCCRSATPYAATCTPSGARTPTGGPRSGPPSTPCGRRPPDSRSPPARPPLYSLRKSQETIESGVRRIQACRPSCGISSMPKFLTGKIRSASASSGHGSPVRGASPTKTALPDSSTPRSSSYDSPESTTTEIRGSLRRSDQRRLRVIEYSHSDPPSQANHRAPTCGRPSGETVATRQVFCSRRKESTSASLIMMRRPRRCGLPVRDSSIRPAPLHI